MANKSDRPKKHSMQNVWQICLGVLGVGGLAAAAGNVQQPVQWLGLLCAFAAGLAFALMFAGRQGTPPPATPMQPRGAYTPSGIDFAWTTCARFVDSQLQSIERLDVKLGIVIAGLVSAAGVFFDRAHGSLAAVLGCVSLFALLFAVLGFLQGHYRDSPDPRDAADSVNTDARITKARLLDGFTTTIGGNQLVIYRKGLYLHFAAILIFAVVVIATFAKAHSEIPARTDTSLKRNAPLSSTARRMRENSGVSGPSRIRHTFPNKH